MEMVRNWNIYIYNILEWFEATYSLVSFPFFWHCSNSTFQSSKMIDFISVEQKKNRAINP